MNTNTHPAPAPGLIREWVNSHASGTPNEAALYLEGTICACCGVDLAPAAEAPALAVEDLSTLPTGGIDHDELTAQDSATFGILASWGIWPDDHEPRAGRSLGESFANQIGAGEAVEYWEVLSLIRSIAHQAYRDGFIAASMP